MSGKPRITIRTDTVSQVQSGNSGSLEDEEVDQAPEEAKVELLKLLTPHPQVREVLRVPRSAQGYALIEALSIAPNKFEALRSSGLSLADAVKVLDLLELALQAQPEEKARRAIARSVVTRVCLPCLFLTEILICGLLIYTLETATGGWEVGKCSLVMFTNITCTEQTTRCAVDVEVRSARGALRFYTMQGWHLPVTFKTEMGGFSFASYLGDRMKCCNDPNGRVGPCCDLMESQSEIFCDNLALLGAKAYDGSPCPGNGWDCLFLIDDFDEAKAKDLQFYTPPDLLAFIIAAGVVAGLLVLAIFWSLIVRYCDCTDCLQRARVPRLGRSSEQDGEEVEVTEAPLSTKPVFRASMTQDTTGTIGEDFMLKTNSGIRQSSRKRGTVRRHEDEELIISPELGHVPQALLTLPGVVQELEMVLEENQGKAARNKFIEEECRKYLKWEAHEKPLTELDDDDIHPHFKKGNLNRFVVMAEQARKQKDAALSPLIEPRPPSAHWPPPVPGSTVGSGRSRPSTAGSRGHSVQAWGARPGSARPNSAKRRPRSAQPVAPHAQHAPRPGSAALPMMPRVDAAAKIEVANL